MTEKSEMFEYDPVANLQRHPTPNMARFGLNPYSEPLYRIVYSDSVRHLVGGEWPDGSRSYHWQKKYSQLHAWVLEKWQAPDCSPAIWDSRIDPLSGFPVLGPYPARGYYELAFVFDKGVDADDLDSLVAAIERKRTMSFQDCRDAIARDYAYEETDTRNQSEAEIRDAVRYRGNAPLSAGRFGRGTKTTPDLVFAEQIGLPIPRSVRRNPKDLRGLDVTSNLTTGAR